MDRDRVSLNDPCPCGSGKKYKQCCLPKPASTPPIQPSLTLTDLEGRPRDRVQLPNGTIALYGPDDMTTTKIAAGVFKTVSSKPIIRRWVATDVTTNPKIQQQIRDFFKEHGVKTIVTRPGNMGCPHEEGEDFPLGEDCPFCPFWAGKQGTNRRE
jgi:hypothetical protein